MAAREHQLWARLGIGHTWLQKLVREYQADPNEMWRLQERRGDPQFAGSQSCTGVHGRDEQRAELHLTRREKLIQWLLT